MAEEFQTDICTGSWWNTMRSGNTSGFDAGSAIIPVPVAVSSCSPGINHDMGYGWTTGAAGISDRKTSFCDDLSISGNSVTIQDVHKDWNQAYLGRTHQTSLIHPMLQEEVSSKPYFHQEGPAAAMESNQIQMGMVEDVNQTFMLHQHQRRDSANDSAGGNTTVINNNFPMAPASYETATSPSMYLQGLLEQDLKFQQTAVVGYGDHNPNYNSFNQLSSNEILDQNQIPSSWPKFPQLFKPSHQLLPQPKQQQQVGQLHFSNNTAFWNAPATALSVNDSTSTRPGFFSPVHNQGFSQNFEAKPISTSNSTVKDSSSVTKKGGTNGPALKKPRVVTPSSLPAFKVRKEKLSDRITALQQLVSPFGKTDTASVLYEAIEYIKFLHSHLDVLSTPYLKNGQPLQQQLQQQQQTQNSEKSKDNAEGSKKQDLRSRGLCLVPISVTFPVANEATSDLWTPNFGGSYR